MFASRDASGRDSAHPGNRREAFLKGSFYIVYPLVLLAIIRVALFFLFGEVAIYHPGTIYRRVAFSLLLYLVYAPFLNRLCSVGLALLTEALLLQISSIKLASIGEPLAFIDVTEIQQNVHLTGYASTSIWVTAAAFLVLLFVGWRYRDRGWKRFSTRLPFALLLPAMFSTLLLSHGMASAALKQGMSMLSLQHRNVFVPAKSLQANGIIGHLLETAQNISLPERGPHHFYDRQEAAVLLPTQPDVLVILCESCFTTQDDRFPTPMRQLEESGLTPFEMLSPVYGGDTAEAEFEVLTGLSSSVMTGVDYQQFANRYRDDMQALPRRFADSGYLTIAMHNNNGIFWRRNVMYPKLGFKELRFLENMDKAKWPTNGQSNWTRDAVLYDSAFESYQRAPAGQKVFMFLLTVGTHGVYKDKNGDLGEKYYLGQLKIAIDDMQVFLKKMDLEAKKRGRPLAIVVFGDHKPALSGVFYRNGVLPHSLYSKHNVKKNAFDFVFLPTPEDLLARSQASVYARFPKAEETRKFTTVLHDRPFFCLSAELAALTPGKDDRFWRGVNAVCHQPVRALLKPEPSHWAEDFPPALYAERLFPDPGDKTTG